MQFHVPCTKRWYYTFYRIRSEQAMLGCRQHLFAPLQNVLRASSALSKGSVWTRQWVCLGLDQVFQFDTDNYAFLSWRKEEAVEHICDAGYYWYEIQIFLLLIVKNNSCFRRRIFPFFDPANCSFFLLCRNYKLEKYEKAESILQSAQRSSQDRGTRLGSTKTTKLWAISISFIILIKCYSELTFKITGY